MSPQSPNPGGTEETRTGSVLGVLNEVNLSISEVAAAMGEVSKAIREEVHIELRTTRRTQIPMLIMLFILICLAISNIYLISSTRATSDQIYDCTQLSGQCYQRNVRSTAGAVNHLDDAANLRKEEIITRMQCILTTNTDCPPPSTTTTTSSGPG